ncbi:MAG: CHAT domain-containing protein [Oscillochloridaceae bacterium umkhey_bin13]
MNASLIITVRDGDADPAVYTVAAELALPGHASLHASSQLRLDRAALLAAKPEPERYGRMLGEALFVGSLRDRLSAAQSQSANQPRVLLNVEPTALHDLAWHLLQAPIGPNGTYLPLAGQADLIYAGYVPAYTAGRFAPIGKGQLRALVAGYSPALSNDFRLEPFDLGRALEDARSALAPIPTEVLPQVTLSSLATALEQGQFTLLHLICHGQQSATRGPTLYLGDDLQPGKTTYVTAQQFLETLRPHPPHLIFLAACSTAVAEPGVDGLAQRLVRELAVPSVVAMASQVSVAGAATLAQAFYKQLQDHGEADRALNEARRRLQASADAHAPVCFTCTPGRPLFATALDRPLVPDEIMAGLVRFEAEIGRRAPVLTSEFAHAAQVLRGYAGVHPAHLAPSERERYDKAFKQITALSNEVFGLSFAAVARDEPLPTYPTSETSKPFPGMLAFQASQGHLFFGRDDIIATQVPRLYQALMAGEAPILSIVGVSGAGKSSLALAGLGATLRGQGRDPSLAGFTVPDLQLCVMRPGADPSRALAQALVEGESGPRLLIIDQGEELFTLCRDESLRKRFTEDLQSVGVPVIITLRDEYRAELYRFAALRRWLNHTEPWLVLLNPPSPDELRDIVEQLASAVSMRLEAGLGTRIAHEAAGEQAPLPLLQHALAVLWDGRRGPWLRLAAYEALGGMRQAIVKTAQQIYAEHPDDQPLIARLIPELILVEPGQHPTDKRRLYRQRRSREELKEYVPGCDPVINRLVEARLLVTSAGMVELAHDALIAAWPQVCIWVEQDLAAREQRDRLRQQQQRINQAALAWQQTGKRRQAVYQGAQLAAAREYLEAGGMLDALASEFVAASERAARQRDRLRLITLSVTTVVAFLAAGLAVWYASQTQQQARAIASLALVTKSRVALATGDSERALALAFAAIEADASQVAAEAALAAAALRPGTTNVFDAGLTQTVALALRPDGREALLADGSLPGLVQIDLAQERPPQRIPLPATAFAVTYTEAGQILVGGDDGTLRRWDLVTGTEGQVLRGHRGPIRAVVALPNASQALSAGDDNTIRLWDLEAARELRVLRHGSLVHSLALTRAADLVVSASEDSVALWDLASGQLVWQQAYRVSALAVLERSSGHEVLIASDDLLRLDGQTGELIERIRLNAPPLALAVAPTDDQVLVAFADGSLGLVDVAMGARITTLRASGVQRPLLFLAVHAPTAHLLTASETGSELRRWDLTSPQELAGPPLVGQALALFQPNGEVLVNDATASLISDPITGSTLMTLPGQPIANPVCAQRSQRGLSALITIDPNRQERRLQVFEPETGRVLYEQLAPVQELTCVAISPEARLFAIAERGGITVRAMADARELARRDGVPAADLSFSPDGNRLVVSTATGQVHSFEAERLTEIWQTALADTRQSLRLSYRGAGDVIAVGGTRGPVHLLDARSGATVRILTGGGDGSVALTFDATGRRLATLGRDNVLRVWDAASGAELRRFEAIGSAVQFVSFAPDGRSLLTLARNELPRRWRVDSGAELQTWAQAYRYVPALSCPERTLYRLACEETFRP